MTRRRSLLLLPFLLLLTQCGGSPPPPVLTLDVTGSPDLNPDAQGNPAPVAIRIYQLRSAGDFEASDWQALVEREQATLGAQDAGSTEVVVAPGQSLSRTFRLQPGVRELGVLVLYRDMARAQWRAIAPVAPRGPSVLRLSVGRSAVALTSVA